jgi:hypothetical protein
MLVCLSICLSVSSKTLQKFINFLIIRSTSQESDLNTSHLRLSWWRQFTKYNYRTSYGAYGVLNIWCMTVETTREYRIIITKCIAKPSVGRTRMKEEDNPNTSQGSGNHMCHMI